MVKIDMFSRYDTIRELEQECIAALDKIPLIMLELKL